MRKAHFILITCIALAICVSARFFLEEMQGEKRVPAQPQRIISLAPSATETLFALGLGPQVTGVTTYCAWPEEVKNKPKVAEFSQLNLEAIVRSKPDLAVVPADKPDVCTMIDKLGIPVVTLSTHSIAEYVDDVLALGRAVGRAAEAEAMAAAFRRELEAAQKRAEGKRKPRVLFAVMRGQEGLDHITEFTAVGVDGFYTDLLELAGGENVYTGRLTFPKLSREAVIFLNPDVIVDIMGPFDKPDSVLKQWQSVPSVRAVREGRILLLSDLEDTVPGPRSVVTLSRLARAFYPDEQSAGGEQNGGESK